MWKPAGASAKRRIRSTMPGSLTQRVTTLEARLELALHDLTELRKQLAHPLVIDSRGLPARWNLSEREAQVLKLYLYQNFVLPQDLRRVLWPDEKDMPYHVVGVINTVRSKIKVKLRAAGVDVQFTYVRGYGTRIPILIKTEIQKIIQAIPK